MIVIGREIFINGNFASIVGRLADGSTKEQLAALDRAMAHQTQMILALYEARDILEAKGEKCPAVTDAIQEYVNLACWLDFVISPQSDREGPGRADFLG